jgi:hypothetical protein
MKEGCVKKFVLKVVEFGERKVLVEGSGRGLI